MPPTPVQDSQRPSVTAQRLIDNGIVNAVASVAGLVISLLLLPIMVNRLGTAAYGVWALALTLTVSGGYLTLLDLGLQQSAVRLMADARGVGDRQALRELFSTALGIFVAVAVPVTVLLLVVADDLAGIFGIQNPLKDQAALAFKFIAAHVLFDLPALAPRALLESDQRFLTVRGIELGRAALLAVAIVALLVSGHGLAAIAAASLVVSALAAGSYLLVAGRSEEGVFSPRVVTRARVRALLSFGGPLFMIRILSVVYRQMDKVILAVTLTVVAVAHYEIASRVHAGIVVLMSAASAAVFPAATVIRGEPERLRELFLRGTSYFVALFLPVTIVILIYAEPLVVGWVGSDRSDAVPLVRLFMIWAALGTFDAVATTILTSLGCLRAQVWGVGTWVASNLVLSLMLVGPLGASGVVIATVVTYVPLLAAWTMLCLKELSIPPREWFRRVLKPNIPSAFVQATLCLFLLAPLSALPGLGAVAIAALVSYPVSLWIYVRFGLDADERARFLSLMRASLLRRDSEPA